MQQTWGAGKLSRSGTGDLNITSAAEKARNLVGAARGAAAAQAQNLNIAGAAGNARRAVGAAVGQARTAAEQGVGQIRGAVSSASTSPWPVQWPSSGGYPSANQSAANPFSGPQAIAHGPLLPVEVRVLSWNLHGDPISPNDDLIRWLTPGSGADIYVIGVQELVELGARSVVLGAAGDEQRQAQLEAHVERAFAQANVEIVKVCSFGMVGQALLIYARTGLAPYIHGLDCDRVKTGMEGLGGNKGCVCARFCLGDVSMCFVNVHLASGQRASVERNQHMAQILSDAFQGTSAHGSMRPAKLGFQRRSLYTISLHQLAVICGDFNSRLDLAKEETWPTGSADAWLQLDQLLLGHAPSLKGFREGLIGFPPTYKYKPGTQDFNKKRSPAWCDRAIYKVAGGIGVELLEYDSYADLCHTSDHHPIAAQFLIEAAKEAVNAAGTPQVAATPAAASTAESAARAVNSETPIALPDAPIALPDAPIALPNAPVSDASRSNQNPWEQWPAAEGANTVAAAPASPTVGKTPWDTTNLHPVFESSLVPKDTTGWPPAESAAGRQATPWPDESAVTSTAIANSAQVFDSRASDQGLK